MIVLFRCQYRLFFLFSWSWISKHSVGAVRQFSALYLQSYILIEHIII